jgi:hypothetical protein
MTVWVAITFLVLATIWIGLALVGAVREQAALRERVEMLERSVAPVHLGGGIPVGRRAPGWSVETATGVVSEEVFGGARHLLIFADATCGACDDLVPEALTAAAAGRIPPVVVVDAGGLADIPGAWSAGASGRGIVGVERRHDVSEAFGVQLTPHAFVVDEGGFVVANGGPTDLDGVRALLREADGIRIVPGADPREAADG